MADLKLSEPGTRDPVATRQGTKQRLNLRVLTASLALILLVSALLYGVFLSAPHSENLGENLGEKLGGDAAPPPVAPTTPAAPATP